MRCEHHQCELSTPTGVDEWRLPDSPEHPSGVLVQWCPFCGAIREICGTEIGFWRKPLNKCL
jgi:hypothetical protein